MRNTSKKVVSVAMATAMVASMAACGGNGGETTAPTTTAASNGGETTTVASNGGETTTAAENGSADVTKPEKITMMVNGTLVTEANGRAAFEKAWEDAVGVDLVINQPDHSQYTDQVSIMFATNSDVPDVLVLSAEQYAVYAKQGNLADITSMWENSELKASGRMTGESVIDGLYIDGKLYGFAPTRGNGCVTYVKKAWLDKLGLSVPTTWDEYVNMLKAFTENDMDGDGDPTNDYGVSAAGLISAEAPYTNYLPEVYQDAYPDFYQKEDGTWVDGFSEQAMQDALQRLQDIYMPGYLDKETLTNNTKACRTKYQDDKFGVFTYWAGTWCKNLSDNLVKNGKDGELISLEPIAELGAYTERQAPVWAITTACKNPEGVFKYFIETMLDGDTVQTLWTYGAQGTHWDNKAETISLKTEDTTTDYVYEEGQFHFLENLETGGSFYTKNHIDPMLSVAAFQEGKDPGSTAASDVAKESQLVFNTHSKMAPVIYTTEEMNDLNGDIWDIKTDIVTRVATGEISAADGITEYNDRAGDMIQEVLDSLNQ